jgi:hypothetical protein
MENKFQKVKVKDKRCPLLPTIFILYVDENIGKWKFEIKDKFYVNNTELKTLLYTNDQVIIANLEIICKNPYVNHVY